MVSLEEEEYYNLCNLDAPGEESLDFDIDNTLQNIISS